MVVIIWQIDCWHCRCRDCRGWNYWTWLDEFSFDSIFWTGRVFSWLPRLFKADYRSTRNVTDRRGCGQLWASIFQSHGRGCPNVIAADLNAIFRRRSVDFWDELNH